jgi:hypothetical protein
MPVYDEMMYAIYPPASYAELWPLLGWLDLEPARRLWAAACAAALVWLALLCGRHAVPAASRPVRAVAALAPLALWSTGHSIGQGQLVVLVLPAILTGVGWALQRGCWGYQVAVALLVLFALVKPSLTAPFFWILVVHQYDDVLLLVPVLALARTVAAFLSAPLAAWLAVEARRQVHHAA